MDDGTELEIGPGDVFSIPPGHDNWTIGDESCIVPDFAEWPITRSIDDWSATTPAFLDRPWRGSLRVAKKVSFGTRQPVGSKHILVVG
jgi:hypothetical protein